MKQKTQAGTFLVQFLFVTAVLAMGMKPSALHAARVKLDTPQWDTPQAVSSDNGRVQLAWKVGDRSVAEYFLLQERFEGKIHTSFVTGRSVEIYRAEPGTYEFTLKACIDDAPGVPVAARLPGR